MNEQQAFRISGNESSAPLAQPLPQKEYRSGVFAKARRDGGGGWGLVLIDLNEPPRPVTLGDGAVVGSASRDARVEGPGVAPEHLKVNVRSDGCYFEDMGAPDGTFVGGVRARRIGVMHGDVVRLGKKLAIFVERDLAAYAGPIERSGDLVHGPKQRRDWIDPVLELVKSGSSVCIEGGPGVGKRSLAKLAAALRESAGEIVTIDGAAEPKTATPPSGARPATWVVLNADHLPRPQQLEIAHAVGRGGGVTIIATTSQPLDRATGDGRVAPWFASLFSGKRIAVPALEARREDVPAIVRDVAERRGLSLARITPEFLEAIVRAGWPGGVPQLEAALVTAAEAAGDDGPLTIASISDSLARASRVKPSLPPSTDPALARARLEDALARANGSVASAARSLGMSRQAIYREADRLGLDIARRKLPRT
jgi:Bacterial regulatory protein, Fis family/FHA domain